MVFDVDVRDVLFGGEVVRHGVVLFTNQHVTSESKSCQDTLVTGPDPQ